MTLAPDKIELAQQIADVLEEGINAGPHVFFGSTRPKSDYFKNLISPLQEKYRIDTLLESLPPHDAKSLRENYSRLISCFDPTGKLLNANLSLTTVNRYADDLIKDLRDIAQRGKQNTTTAKRKAVRAGPQIKHSETVDVRDKRKPDQTKTGNNAGMIPPEIPTKRIPLTTGAKWFNCDYRTLLNDIKSGKIKARQISARRWEFDLDQVTDFDPSLRNEADTTEHSSTTKRS